MDRNGDFGDVVRCKDLPGPVLGSILSVLSEWYAILLAKKEGRVEEECGSSERLSIPGPTDGVGQVDEPSLRDI